MPESASRGGVCSGGCLLWGWGVSALGVSASGKCLFWGGVCSREVYASGESAPRGGVCFQGLSTLGGVCSGGVCSQGGGIPACTEADTLPVNRMTNRCKNITLATTSLRPVINLILILLYELHWHKQLKHLTALAQTIS